MLMLDLCSGLGGASQAMKARGWDVVTVDIEPSFSPDIVADLTAWSWDGERPDLVWCSPPCTEFSRFSMPWFDKNSLPQPDMDLVRACKRIIDESDPCFWIIENVRGAVPFFVPLLGEPAEVHNPFFLWGHFPPLGNITQTQFKEHLPSTAIAKRAKIPESLSLAVATAIESQPSLPMPRYIVHLLKGEAFASPLSAKLQRARSANGRCNVGVLR